MLVSGVIRRIRFGLPLNRKRGTDNSYQCNHLNKISHVPEGLLLWVWWGLQRLITVMFLHRYFLHLGILIALHLGSLSGCTANLQQPHSTALCSCSLARVGAWSRTALLGCSNESVGVFYHIPRLSICEDKCADTALPKDLHMHSTLCILSTLAIWLTGCTKKQASMLVSLYMDWGNRTLPGGVIFQSRMLGVPIFPVRMGTWGYPFSRGPQNFMTPGSGNETSIESTSLDHDCTTNNSTLWANLVRFSINGQQHTHINTTNGKCQLLWLWIN